MTALTPPYAAPRVGNDCETAIPKDDPTAASVARPRERLRVPIKGDLDLYTTHDLTQWLCPLAARGWQLTLDLSGLEFLGVAGLMLFVQLHDAAGASGGSLQLDSVPESTRRVLRIVGLDALLERAPAPSTISLLPTSLASQ